MDALELLDSAREACLQAAAAVLRNTDRGLHASRSGYNTRSDILANDAIISELRKSSTDMPILSEEGGTGSNGKGPIWIVDPLDGTWNFHHGGAKWSVSIAAVDAHGPICAVVHAPLLGETYEYASGMARPLRNGDPISPSNSTFPGEWIVAAGAPSHAQARAKPYLENLSMDLDTGDPLRPARINLVMYGRGSMALELCHLASGRIDGALRFGQKVWDIAAGLCIALGAGCAIEAMNGGPIVSRLHSSGYDDEFDLIVSSTGANLAVLRMVSSGEPRSLNGVKNK